MCGALGPRGGLYGIDPVGPRAHVARQAAQFGTNPRAVPAHRTWLAVSIGDMSSWAYRINSAGVVVGDSAHGQPRRLDMLAFGLTVGVVMLYPDAIARAVRWEIDGA